MQWAASGQSQLIGWERGAKALTDVVAAPQSIRKAAGGFGGVGCHPAATLPLPADLQPLPAVLLPRFPTPQTKTWDLGCSNASAAVPPAWWGSDSCKWLMQTRGK